MDAKTIELPPLDEEYEREKETWLSQHKGSLSGRGCLPDSEADGMALACRERQLLAALKSLSERDQQIASMLVTAEHSEKLVDGLLKEKEALHGTLEWVLNDVQEWCDAVAKDSSWDGWDYHYKSFAYGGIAEARQALHPSPSAPKEAQDGE